MNAEFTAYTNSGWLVASNFMYTYTNNHTPGYNASIPLWSPSIDQVSDRGRKGP
ncbi:MAG TPA: hypothetical protein VHE34_24200 [Puia sp.]|uniref:hypothetical protein n=1 Tax=Puia sp. TaxID=2045100 RepID=UPI002CAA2421|nr:hypothetical protein [Puia sp.]HVU98357.1 hypothetical protein [Puia sp.]